MSDLALNISNTTKRLGPTCLTQTLTSTMGVATRDLLPFKLSGRFKLRTGFLKAPLQLHPKLSLTCTTLGTSG